MSFNITGPHLGKAASCEPILHSLPQWFGIDEAIANYLTEIEGLPTLLACNLNHVLGFLTIKQHYPYSAEILVMGILPEAHRQGIGKALMDKAEAWLRERHIEYLEVKTLGPSSNDPNYAKTRAFYMAMGFRPLEELMQIWDEQNPCLILVKRL